MLRIKDDEIFFPMLSSVPVLGVICNRALEVHANLGHECFSGVTNPAEHWALNFISTI